MRGKPGETLIIFSEETRRHLRSGGYLFFTVGIALLMIAAVWVVPLIQKAIASDAPPPQGDVGRIGFVDNSGVLSGLAGQEGPYKYATLAEGLEVFRRGEIDALFVVADDYLETGKVVQYAKFGGRFPATWTPLSSAFVSVLANELIAGQLEPDIVARLAEPASFENYRVEDDGSLSEIVPAAQEIGELIVPAVFAMLLMFSIIAGVGNMVTSISEDKENRLVELVITSASPFSIMAGKLLSLGAIGLTQAAVWVVVAAFTVPAMFDQIPDAGALTIPASLAVTILACFLTGYFLSTTIAILVGAVSPSTREASRTAPMVSMVGFVPIWFMGFLITQPDGLITRLLTYIPFTAPTGILMRISVGGEMSGAEIAGALAGVVAVALIFLWISGRVFRAAMLMQGQKFTPSNLWSALRNAD